MHAVVRGERLLGIPKPNNNMGSTTAEAPMLSKPILEEIVSDIPRKPEANERHIYQENPDQEKVLNPFSSAFTALILLSLFMNIPISLIGPFFPNEAIGHGVSLRSVGFILSAFPLSVFLSAPVWGYSVPYLGPKILIIGGGITTGVCVASFSLIDHLHGGMFICFGLIIRFFQGIGCAATETGATAMLAGRFPDSIGTVTGLMDVAESLGFMVGPLFGGVLYQHWGFQAPFLVIGGFTLALMIPLVWLVPTRAQRFQQFSDISVLEVLRTPGIALVVLAAVVGMSVFAYLELALQPHFIGSNLSASELGLLFTLISAVYAICSPCVGWATSPRNTRPFIVLGLIIIAFALCLLSGSLPWTGLEYQIFALILISAGCSLVLVPVVPSMTYAVLHLGDHALGVISGIITSSFSLGEVCGPAIGGILMQVYGFRAGTVFYACIILVVALALLLFIATSGPDQIWSIDRSSNQLVEPLVYRDSSSYNDSNR
uniref:Major facilitator superfamily (MFS) profile domain-containing protein n=1 Tax=Spongospora subterranea TaxID=70186 RepID=A0A0H5R908_9EUKA|eukprot:CRZ10610.1 hypothetical protein [Spongospora subterranea]